MTDQINPSANDNELDEDYPSVICPFCSEQNAIEYIGEAYDDEEHLGGSYNCLECGHSFADADVHLW